jgi:uncharacterized protein (TIGR03437 family)
VSASQVNALLPPDLEPGETTLEISTREGQALVAVTLEKVAPALFSYVRDGKTYAATVAHPGGRFELYAGGLGATSPPHPVGQLLREPYPLAEPLAALVDGRRAAVEFAGMTQPGLYQVNIVLPEGLPAGDVTVVLEAAGKRSPGVLLRR